MNIKRALQLTLVGFVGLTLAGCSSMHNKMSGASLALEEVGTSVKYEIVGDAKGTATVAFLFHFFQIEGERKSGTIGGQSISGFRYFTPAQRAALYNAIESVPGADSIVSPRWQTKRENYVVFTRETVTVTGKAIRLVNGK